MIQDATNAEIRHTPSGSTKWLPVVVAAAMPLSFGIWWWANRTSQSGVPAASPKMEETAREDRQSEPSPIDPWLELDQTIYPRGRIETVHQTDEFTFLFVRGDDSDRWIATQPVKLNRGDIVQYEVAPRSIKVDFKSKALGRVFPSIVLVGQDRVKLIQAAKSGEKQPQ